MVARPGPLPRHHGFVAKYDTYDILGAAGELDDDMWQLPSGDARPGDRLLFWRTNDREGRRGVAALGEVVAGPALITEPEASRRFWKDSPPEGPVRRIRFRFLPAPRFPVWLGDGHDDLLTSLSVSDAQGNKLYKVTPEQWTLLGELAGVAMDGREADDEQPAQEDLVEADERGRARRRGQGFSSNPEFNRAVEMRAMDVARAHYGDDGWTVTDTSAHRPYDLVAEKRDDLKYVEVKGTTGDASAVTVTYNEVEHAEAHPDQAVLFVVAGIEVTQGDNGLVAVAGEVTMLDPWRPKQNGELRPIAYRFTLPRDTTSWP